MTRKSNEKLVIDFKRLANLIYYNKYFHKHDKVKDPATSLSFETILSICSKHLGIDESELLSKKGTKYSYHRHIFIGALYFYLDDDERTIGKKIKRYAGSIVNGAEVLSYYLEEWRDYNAASLNSAVVNILIECERESNFRIYKNVTPKLYVFDSYSYNNISISNEEENYYSKDDVLDIPVRPLGWFQQQYYRSLTAFCLNSECQYKVSMRGKGQDKQDKYLYLMQSFGYRFVDIFEYTSTILQQTNEIQNQTLHRLKNISSRSNNTKLKKIINPCKNCFFSHECNQPVKNNTELAIKHCTHIENSIHWNEAVKKRSEGGVILLKSFCDTMRNEETFKTMFNLN
jgi:hypothetical protein